MEKKLTIFQRLGRLMLGDKNISNVNSYQLQSDVLFKATSPEEYETKALETKQQHLLAKQWKKAAYDINNKSIAGLNNIKMMYRDADLMDAFPEIGTALDIVSEEVCFVPTSGFMVNVTSKSERIKSILQDLFVNRLSINTLLPMITRATCKYGNQYMLLNIDKNNGIIGWKQLPVYEMERYENGMTLPYTNTQVSLNNIDIDKEDSTKFVWMGQNEFIPYRNWQIAHFRLLYDNIFLPYGCLVGDTKVEMEFGYKNIKDITVGDKVWTFNVDTQERELGIVTVTQNKGDKNVFKLHTKHYEVEGTEDHKFLICENNNLLYKELKDIKIGDLLVCDNLQSRNNKKIKINKEPLQIFEANIERNTSWWDDFIDAIPDYITEDFARLFGFLLGDGWLSHGYHVMMALGEHDTINYRYMSLLEQFSKKQIHFVKQAKNSDSKLKYHTAYVGSKMLYIILKRMGFDGNVVTKKIPSWIFKCENNIKKAFLEGLIDADGCLKIVNDKTLAYTIELANESIIKDMKILAQSLGYKTNKIGKRERIGYTTKLKDGKTITTQNVSYYFTFYQKHNKQNKCCDNKNRLTDLYITEKVTKIIPNGIKTTYDITIDGNENSNFFANGIVTHNCSFLNKARRHFRMLSMMEDMMLIYRLERSVERRVFKINVGTIDDADVPSYVQQIADNFKRTPIVDPMTGQLDLRKNILSQQEDFFIPVREDGAASPIETLPAAQNLSAMDDIKFIQNKLLTALRIPKSFLNFEQEKGDGKNLSLLDVRFTRTVNRIQQSLLMELNKIAIIHLYLLGFTDDLTNFSLSMNNPSSQIEMLELENMAKKITTAKDAMTDGGNGIPLMSATRAWKQIMKWSDKEIEENLEELRLERALAAELERTSQIISRTGIFDSVDNIYGEPGATYSDGEQGNGEEGMDMGGGAGGPGAGALDFGGDIGGEEGMDMGDEGEMSMDAAAAEGGGGGETIGEAVMRRVSKKVETEKKKIQEDLMSRSKYYQDLLLKRINKKDENITESFQNTELYNKTFFVNEELNDISKDLNNFTTVLNVD